MSKLQYNPKCEEQVALANKICNVMQTNTVVKTIFSYLSLNDIKNCRFVCQNWKSIAQPLLRKRSKIVFQFSSGRSPRSFLESFGFSDVNINFTSFSFSRDYWPKHIITNFLEGQRGKIQELEFDNITLTTGGGEEIENPCISDWIGDLSLKKLSVFCSQPRQPIYRNWDCNLVVSLDVLQSVQEIILDSCKINVRPGNKIAPAKLKLNFVAICNEGSIQEEFCINNLIDFKKATTIEIKCPIISNTCRGTKFQLDLQECTELTDLKLTQTVVRNSDVDNFNFKNLFLDGIPFFGSRSMKIKKLSYQCSVIDLADVSTEVEEIYLYSYANSVTPIYCSLPTDFPQLKCLHLYGETAGELCYFRTCENLIDLYIGGHHDHVLRLKLIPRSVKRLHLGMVKNIVADKPQKLEVDLLVLDSYPFDQVEKVLEKIKPQNLVLDRKMGQGDLDHHIMSFVNKFRDIKSIYAGPFPTDAKYVYSWKRLCAFVDKKSSFYVFENQKGKAMSKEDFENCKIPTQ